MKPRSKHIKRIIPIHHAPRVDNGGRRYHTGDSGTLIRGKPEHGQVICFRHQTAQHICHCNSPDQIQVSVRTRIPRKGHNAAWKALRKHLGPLVTARLERLCWSTQQQHHYQARRYFPTLV